MTSPQFAALTEHILNLRKLFVLFVIVSTNLKLSHCWRNSWIPDNDTVVLSTPEECKRQCQPGDVKNCYYKFHIEFYTVIGPACDRKEQWKECIWADGVEKTMTAINRMFPGPSIEVCLGDRVVVDVENAAPGTEVTMHWHGLFQNGYQYYDGVPYVTQCPIPSSSTFRYDFVTQNAGTHFYHSHVSTYMLDGQSGWFIIRDPNDPHKNLYDVDDFIIILNDWMHELSLERFPGRYRTNLGQSAENVLINGLGNWTDPNTKQTTNARLKVFKVKPGLRYRIRIINSFSTVCMSDITFYNHKPTVIAQDGANVKPKEVDTLVTLTGERVDVIIKMDQEVDSYWIQVRGLGECALQQVQQFAILQYEGGPLIPSTPQPGYNDVPNGATYNSLDTSKCNTDDTQSAVCVNQLESLEEDPEIMKVDPDVQYTMDFWFFNYTQYGNRLLFQTNSTYPSYLAVNDGSQILSMFNNISFETPSSPLLTDRRSYQTICRNNAPSTCTQPCSCTEVVTAKLDDIVEILMYDSNQLEYLHHPFHLHGYEFKLFNLGNLSANGNITAADVDQIWREHKERLQQGGYKNPPGKDTVKIPQGGYAIIRFKANNPGWWLIHCHFSWHHATGMELVIHVGTQRDLPPVPRHFPTCSNWKPTLHALNDYFGYRVPSS